MHHSVTDRLTGRQTDIQTILSSQYCVQYDQLTRKLSYRKDDRMMHPMYECPENFWESLTMPTGNIPEIFNGLFFDWRYEYAYKIWSS